MTTDGRVHEIDTIVLGTGFKVTDISLFDRIRVRERRAQMAETWKGGLRAYLGTSVPGFPNLFLISGPNTGLGHTSLALHDRVAAHLLLDALRQMDERWRDPLEVRRDAPEVYNEDLQRRLVPLRVEHGWLRELVPRRARTATQRCGRTSPGGSGRRRVASTPRRTC